jgi:hypothetical protein
MTEKTTDPLSRPSIGVSILSWRSWSTPEKTLKSYRDAGLFDVVDKVILYYQDLCDRDIEIAETFGLQYTGGPNCGIAEGMRNGANYLGTDYVLFLENDCPVIVSRDKIKHQLSLAVDFLESGRIDVVRLRSRLFPGEGFSDIINYFRYYRPVAVEPDVDISGLAVPAWQRWLRRVVKSHNLYLMKGRGLYVEKYPEQLFPDAIEKTEDSIWIGDSSCMDWTNQSVVCKRVFFTDILIPYVDAHPSSRLTNGFQDPERPLNCRWWRRQHFKIGQGSGLFTHDRLDSS